MKIINLTPHAINFPTMCIAPSGQIARVSCESLVVGYAAGIPLKKSTYGEVTGLPEPQDGVTYVVSAMVRNSCPNRKDLGSPSELIRDEENRVIGCNALDIN